MTNRAPTVFDVQANPRLKFRAAHTAQLLSHAIRQARVVQRAKSTGSRDWPRHVSLSELAIEPLEKVCTLKLQSPCDHSDATSGAPVSPRSIFRVYCAHGNESALTSPVLASNQHS
jgi:hypothetical protein